MGRVNNRWGVACVLDQQFLKMLACPLTGAPLVLDGEWLVSTDAETRRAYPIKDEFPSLLLESSKELETAEHAAILERHGLQPYTGKRKKIRP